MQARPAPGWFKLALLGAFALALTTLLVTAGTATAGPLSPTHVWSEQGATAGLPSREMSMIAFDASSGEMFLFGGMGPSNMLNDTWLWEDGEGWIP